MPAPKKKRRPALYAPRPVTPPFRAEMPKRGSVGTWRDHIEEAMADARALGTGARVVASDGTLLAKFENAARGEPRRAPADRGAA